MVGVEKWHIGGDAKGPGPASFPVPPHSAP